MEFTVLSRAQVQNNSLYGLIKDKHLIISINEDPLQLARIPDSVHCQGRILRMVFDDIDIESNGTMFTEENALTILNYVDEYIQDVSRIVVHCHAGVSRSVAVAAALSKIINGSDDTIFKSGCPNMKVYTTILETYFLEPKYTTKWPNILSAHNQQLSPYGIACSKVPPKLVTMVSGPHSPNNPAAYERYMEAKNAVEEVMGVIIDGKEQI
jgi:rhodanese-related sulfurtransferase